MDHKTIARACPWKVALRGSWYCKALVDQPNGRHCREHNCAAWHIANLLINELRGGHNENATSTTASARRDKS